MLTKVKSPYLPFRSFQRFDSVNNDSLLNKLVQLNIDSTWYKVIFMKRQTFCPHQSPIYMEYIMDQYSVQSSLTF